MDWIQKRGSRCLELKRKLLYFFLRLSRRWTVVGDKLSNKFVFNKIQISPNYLMCKKSSRRRFTTPDSYLYFFVVVLDKWAINLESQSQSSSPSQQLLLIKFDCEFSFFVLPCLTCTCESLAIRVFNSRNNNTRRQIPLRLLFVSLNNGELSPKIPVQSALLRLNESSF